jgi:hypothetical protein
MQAKFFNFSDEPFGHPSLGGTDEHCQWNKSPYFFPPKTEMVLELGIAEHLAKHLANRELQRKDNPYGSERDTSPKKPEENPRFMKVFKMACIPLEEVKATPTVHSLDTSAIPEVTKRFCEFCDSKGVRHKKDCPTLKQSAEESFEGLNETV